MVPPPRSLLRYLQVIALSLPQPSSTYSTEKFQPEKFTTALRQYTRVFAPVLQCAIVVVCTDAWGTVRCTGPATLCRYVRRSTYALKSHDGVCLCRTLRVQSAVAKQCWQDVATWSRPPFPSVWR